MKAAKEINTDGTDLMEGYYFIESKTNIITKHTSFAS
jgi:hypothetical protein